MIYLVLASLSWSIVGVLVKIAGLQFDSYTITFARFSIGVVALAGVVYFSRHSLRPATFYKWIWIGAIGKSANYLFENVAITIGHAYGNMLVQPIQTIVLLVAGIFLFKERLTAKSWLSGAVVLGGVLLITLNGRSLGDAIAEQGWITALFALSGIGAALHFLSQKMLLDSMNDVSMNYSIFFWASFVSAVPLPFAADWQPSFVPGAWLSAAGLGLITGFSFLMLSKALRTVKFSVAVIVSNMAALFTVLWSGVFLREPITMYIVIGAFTVVAGMTMLNWPGKPKPSVEPS
ncbi:DMT family transporter [Paenibacillus antri]|uniref:DMT family transporter n=1 Tax=Paenibacillus antri TaxID=2582848 RepID=A0A5R9G625_9BACL|nr:DMT family transporter [Paenibacillus antri]TLS49560.1 DMT family transporter [Paenibacillus antri]